jgi:hypothetical protein
VRITFFMLTLANPFSPFSSSVIKRRFLRFSKLTFGSTHNLLVKRNQKRDTYTRTHAHMHTRTHVCMRGCDEPEWVGGG